MLLGFPMLVFACIWQIKKMKSPINKVVAGQIVQERLSIIAYTLDSCFSIILSCVAHTRLLRRRARAAKEPWPRPLFIVKMGAFSIAVKHTLEEQEYAYSEKPTRGI